MTVKFSYLIFCLTISLLSSGQDTTKQNLFRDGIFIENFDITIPWSTDYKKIVSVGNPKIDTSSKRFIRFTWDSVQILNGVKIKLTFSISRHNAKTNKPLQLISFHGTINASDFAKICDYFSDHTNNKNGCSDRSGGWKINGSLIKAGIFKRPADKGHFDIQKVLPKQNGM